MFTLDDFVPDDSSDDSGDDSVSVPSNSGSGQGVDPCQSYDPFDVLQCAGTAISNTVTNIFGSLANPATNELNYVLILLVAGIIVLVALVAFNARDLSKIFKVNAIV
jgi:hypothetical protein